MYLYVGREMKKLFMMWSPRSSESETGRWMFQCLLPAGDSILPADGDFHKQRGSDYGTRTVCCPQR